MVAPTTTKARARWTPTAIKRLRKKLGLTQREFGEAVGGVWSMTVCNWEQGNQQASPVSLRRMTELADGGKA